jgi:hypothetical protein
MNLPTKTPWNKAIDAVALDQHRLRVQMDDGRRIILDLGPLIHRHDAYWRLRRNRYFRRVNVDPLGGICWPEGEDLAPDGLERYTVIG